MQSEMVASTILNLCLKKVITLDIEGKNIYISILGDGSSLKKEEYQVYKLLYEASKGKERLEITELNDYAKKHYSNYSMYINQMVNETRNELYNMQLIDKKEEKMYRKSKSANMFLNGILCIFIFILTFLAMIHIPTFLIPMDISLGIGSRESFTILVLGITPLILVMLYSLHLKTKIENKIAVITQKGYDEKVQWEALKRFLEDYSLLNEKEVPQLVVWEKYLVYATAFGISNKVIHGHILKLYRAGTKGEAFGEVGSHHNGNIRQLGNRANIQRCALIIIAGKILPIHHPDASVLHNLVIGFGQHLKRCRYHLFKALEAASRHDILHKLFPLVGGPDGIMGAGAGGGLDHRFMEQSFGAGSLEKVGDLSAAARLAEDGYVIRVTAERRNVVFDPLERRNNIGKTDVSGIFVLFSSKRGYIHPA